MSTTITALSSHEEGNREWLHVATFASAFEAVQILPALALALGRVVRCPISGGLVGADVPPTVTQDGNGNFQARPQP